MKRPTIRPTALLLTVLAVVSAACASSDSDTATAAGSTTVPDADTTLSTEGDAAPSSDAELPDGWLDSVIAAVDTMHAERAGAAALFASVWMPGPPEYDAQLMLFESDVTSARAAAQALPEPPGIADVDDAYQAFVTATDELASDADRVTGALRDDEAALRGLLEEIGSDGEPASEIVRVIGDHDDVYGRWTRACFDLQAAIGERSDEPIDCIGIERTPDEVTAAASLDPALVEVSVGCVRGDSLDELGWDTAAYPWLAATPRDANWIRSLVTIENRSDRHVQLDPGFRVHYLDGRGELIAERDWLEAAPSAHHAAPGQTIHRTGYAFEGVTFTLGLRGEAPPATLLENVFTRLETCTVVDRPQITAFDANPHLDPELASLIEVACAELDPGGFFFAEETITAPEDEDLWVEIGIEYVDASGNRQGLGGSREGPARVAAGETVTRVGDSVAYTINDPAAVTDCLLHSVRRCPDECGPRP